jgi:TetR/AcrR family transcriptional regulator, transcriptional repressor for nem operon
MTNARRSSIGEPRGPGRPREFDMDKALDQAIGVFRARGFHATSIGDLKDATDLTAGSIYKAFKDKRAVFLAAFERYTTLRNSQVRAIAGTAKSGRDRISDLLAFYVRSAHGTEGRLGCLVVGSAVEMAIYDPEIAARVTSTLKSNEAMLAGVIKQGQSDGSISPAIDAEDTARVLVCLTQGLRVVGKTGRPPPAPDIVVNTAMKLLA